MTINPVDKTKARLACFAHLNAPNAELYQAVLSVFYEARERYQLHLRATEITTALADRHGDARETEASLDQLCQWGNLESYADSTHVQSLEDFYRRRLLYQLTAEGVAAERAVREFHRMIDTPAALQSAALASVRDRLAELMGLAQAAEQADWSDDAIDIAKADSILRGLFSDLDNLTDQAQGFFRNLQATVELRGISIDAFLAFKERLVQYLERFLQQVIAVGTEVEALLDQFSPAVTDTLIDRIAKYRTVDEMDVTSGRIEMLAHTIRQQWHGLERWFVASATTRSQADELKGLARTGIREIAAAILHLNQQRGGVIDRSADLRKMGIWFAECADDRMAHRLWRAVFAMSPARHFTVTEETLREREQRPIPASTSWPQAPPLRIAPSLRRTGRVARSARVPQLVDNRESLRVLAEWSRKEAEQLERARLRLLTNGRCRLSDLDHLDEVMLPIFLDLIGDALSCATTADESMETFSSDGSLRIWLQRGNDNHQVYLETDWGTFHGHDYYVEISERHAS